MNCCKNTPSEAELAALKAERGVYTLLGLAQRAGKLTAGTDAVIAAVGRGDAKLVLLAADLSENAQKRLRKAWQNLPNARSITVWRFGGKADLGQAAGRRPCGVWALGDVNFVSGLNCKLAVLQKAGRAGRGEPGK